MIRKKGKKKKRIVAAVLLGIALYAAIMGIAFGMIRAAGKRSLRGNSETARPGMMPVKAGEELTQEEEQQWQEGWVKYQGNLYAYNEDILTFLFMGIDKDSGGERVTEGTDGGNADALFLAVMNPKKKTVQIIGINRNTMADVDIYDEKGNYLMTSKAQITVQHGFGNGLEESCEYQKKAVSDIFF